MMNMRTSHIALIEFVCSLVDLSPSNKKTILHIDAIHAPHMSVGRSFASGPVDISNLKLEQSRVGLFSHIASSDVHGRLQF